MSRTLLDHSIVGQSLTSLTIRKDRQFAACAICGAIFQSCFATDVSDEEWARDAADFTLAVAIETKEWRDRHNKKHSPAQHRQFKQSGLTLTPEAAHKLAPFGIVSLDVDEEVAHAMAVAPRAPSDDVETSLKGWR